VLELVVEVELLLGMFKLVSFALFLRLSSRLLLFGGEGNSADFEACESGVSGSFWNSGRWF